MAPLEVAGPGKGEDVNDQEIRAAAAQAAATLMAPVQPQPVDFVAVAEVVEAYIRNGKDAAFALCPAPVEAAPPAEPAYASVSTISQPAPAAVQQIPRAPVAAVPDADELVIEETEEPGARVIPLAAHGAVSQKQAEARRIIERTKKERVDAIVAEAALAKAKGHKQRLADQVEDNGLADYPVLIEGETMTLGAYIGSL